MKWKIAVIGSGVIGLTSAVRLQEQFGHQVSVTIYTKDKSPNTTGDVSAGLWTPYLLQDTPPDNVIKWAKETQDFFLKLWKTGYASEAGISLQAMINVKCDGTGLPSWSEIGIGIRKMEDKELEAFRKEHGKPYTFGCTYTAFICEPSKLLPFLEKRFIENGGQITLKKIENFDQLKNYDLIINCTGLYSKILVNDDHMKAIRGQVARVDAPWAFHVIMDDSDDGCYIIPNEKCVILGGTHQMDDEDLKPRQSDGEMILKGCQKMIPSLHAAKIIKHQVGLRPGRNKVRIELEPTKIDRRTIPIIHNYGHGGSGVTLCYGCAGNVVELTKLVMSRSKL